MASDSGRRFLRPTAARRRDIVRRTGCQRSRRESNTKDGQGVVVIVITGPIASGKSTLARELARRLEGGGVRAAVIDLDLVHDALIANGRSSDVASWEEARRRAASEANALARHETTVVIAEGSFNLPGDRAAFV